jgi:hypothetical protein
MRALILAAVVASVCLAEKCPIEGTVKNDQGAGIPQASVTIRSSLGTVVAKADKSGAYSTTVECTETSKHTVTVSRPGYTFQPSSRPWEKYSAGPNFVGRKIENQKPK